MTHQYSSRLISSLKTCEDMSRQRLAQDLLSLTQDLANFESSLDQDLTSLESSLDQDLISLVYCAVGQSRVLRLVWNYL